MIVRVIDGLDESLGIDDCDTCVESDADGLSD